MMTCAFCGREGPDETFTMVDQVSNPVIQMPCCSRRFSCYLRAIRNIFKGEDEE